MPKVQSNSISLYYEVRGEGQPLVFLHGLGSSTRDWESQVPEFSRSHRVITVDLRGHGQSDKPEGPYSMAMFAADLGGLFPELGIDCAHLVGLSLGGAVALQFALDNPSLVRTLTIVNSGPTLGGTQEQAQQEIARRVSIVERLGMRAMGLALAPNLFPKPEQAAVRETFAQRWAENDARAYIEATRSMLGWDVTDRLEIACPTLIIAADQDYTPVATKQAYVKLLPHAELVVIPDAHHATPIEAPGLFNAVLQEFLSRH